MRLWHNNLISYLPRQQLLGQWRECCLIAKNIAEKGTPNHILVNPIMDYPPSHFISYCLHVAKTLAERGYEVDMQKIEKLFSIDMFREDWQLIGYVPTERRFQEWHTDRYLEQCLMNLEEKHDRGGISDDEWVYILENVKK